MRETGRVERLANRAHHAVDHAAGGHHVGARPGVNHGLLGQQFQRGIVLHVEPAGRAADRPAMAMIGIFAAADVGDDEKLAGRLLGRADGLGDDARVAGGVAAQGILRLGMPKSITPPSPSSAACLISSASMSGDNWHWPGIAAIGSRSPRPGRTNSGKIRLAGETVVSRTNWRTDGDSEAGVAGSWGTSC